MAERTFTLDEAQSLLPVLESLLRTAIASKKVMEEVEAEQQALSHRIFLNGGTFVDVVPLARRKAERLKAEGISARSFPSRLSMQVGLAREVVKGIRKLQKTEQLA